MRRYHHHHHQNNHHPLHHPHSPLEQSGRGGGVGVVGIGAATTTSTAFISRQFSSSVFFLQKLLFFENWRRCAGEAAAAAEGDNGPPPCKQVHCPHCNSPSLKSSSSLDVHKGTLPPKKIRISIMQFDMVSPSVLGCGRRWAPYPLLLSSCNRCCYALSLCTIGGYGIAFFHLSAHPLSALISGTIQLPRE